MLSSVFPLSGRENKAFYTSYSKAAAILFYDEKCHNIPAEQLKIGKVDTFL